MIDLNRETLIPISHAAKLVPARRGRKVHTSTVFRWCRDGVIGRNGERVFLEHLRIGAGWYVSKESLQRFAESLTEVPDAPPPIRSATQRERAAAAAGKKLESMGI